MSSRSRSPRTAACSRREDPIKPAIQIRTIFYKEVGPEYVIASHTIRCLQWYYVLHGTVRSRVAGQSHTLQADDSMILLPDVPRDRIYGGRAPGYMVVEFDSHGLDFEAVAHRVLALPPLLRDDLHALVGEVRNPTSADAQVLIQALVVRLLIGLKRENTAAESTGTDRISPLNDGYHRALVERIDRYLQHNLRNPIRRPDVARAVSLSDVHMARLYRRITGRTVATRLRELRVELAKELLLDTTLPITTISLEVGFDSFSHFATLFRRSVGVTPSDYRRSGGKAWA